MFCLEERLAQDKSPPPLEICRGSRKQLPAMEGGVESLWDLAACIAFSEQFLSTEAEMLIT